MNELPTLPSIDENKVKILFPCIFSLASTKTTKEGTHQKELMVEIFANGKVVMHKNTTDEAARLFWFSVAKNILDSSREMQLTRDITFIIAFLQSKGVFFSNPNEKIELFAWIGEMERRYGIVQS